MKTNYSALKKAGKLTGTIKAATEKAADRAARTTLPLTKPTKTRMLEARLAIDLGPDDLARIWALAETAHPRRKNWETPQAATTRQADGWMVQDINHGRYSSRCTYTHWSYRPLVTSYAWLSAPQGRMIGFRHWTTITHIAAPRGYRWAQDSNGLKLVSRAEPRDDYHPTSDDLKKGGAWCAKKLRENALSRRQAEREKRADIAAVRLAEKEGAAICMADSLKAGNCKTGTERFAARHGLDPARHYRPTELLKIANGDAHRVRLAVAVGLRRHRHEMAAGVCDLADHRA